MSTEPTRSQAQTHSADAGSGTTCPNCHAQMPRELRFCRSCGFRLGEGVAEFTETARFDKVQTGAATRGAPRLATARPPTATSCTNLNDWGALAKDVSEKTLTLARDVSEKAIKSATTHLERQREKKRREKTPPQPRPRTRWLPWLIVAIIIAVVSSGGLMRISGLRGLRDSLRDMKSANAPRSWVGTTNFKSADNGVTFDQVEPAGSPADKAGLVGGDVITTFDGQAVKSPGELRNLLTATPVGKTVEVVYLRDGETKKTMLTTISEAELEQLNDAAGERTRGFVGIGNSYELARIPGTNITGVQLTRVRVNNPAYTAGIRSGDVVIEFDGVPIRTYDELESRTRRAAPDSTVKVVLMRGTERLEILVKVGVDD